MIGSFDRIGFARHSRRFRPGELDVDLSGRLCLVTGGNAGLGRAAAEALATRGASVLLLCRDVARGETARDEIRRSTGNRRVELAVVDVSDLAAIRRWVDEARLSEVHVLVHNAGLLPARRTLTADGLELTFATHVVGPHLLTSLLGTPLRLMQKRRPQIGAACFETRLGIAHGGQRVIDHALAFLACAIDHRLRTRFGFEQALQLVVHVHPFVVSSRGVS